MASVSTSPATGPQGCSGSTTSSRSWVDSSCCQNSEATMLASASSRTSSCASAEPEAARDSCSSRSEEHTSELQSPCNLVCRLLLEKKKQHNHQSASRST